MTSSDEKLPFWLTTRAARLAAAVTAVHMRLRPHTPIDPARFSALLTGGVLGTRPNDEAAASQFSAEALRRGIGFAPVDVPAPTLQHQSVRGAEPLLTAAAKVVLATPPPLLRPLLNHPVDARAAFCLVGLSAFWHDEIPPSPRALGHLLGVIDSAPQSVLIPVYDRVLKWVEAGAYVRPLPFMANIRELHQVLVAQRVISADDVWREAWKRREWRLTEVHGAVRLADDVPVGSLHAPRRVYRTGPRARWDGAKGDAPTTQIELFW